MSLFSLFQQKVFNFSPKLRKIYLAIACIVIFISNLSLYKNKLNYGIDFTGGLVINIEKTKDLKVIESQVKIFLQNISTDNSSNINYSVVDDYEYFVLKIKENNNFEITPTLKKEIYDFLSKEKLNIIKIDLIGRSISEKFIRNVIFCVCFALFAVFVYILIVFNLKFGLSGVFSLVANVFFLLFFISTSQVELTLIIITAILTIIGYSINDTIVIFDRIRENVSEKFHQTKENQILNVKTNQKTNIISKKDSEEIITDSIRKVLTRSILTSLITLIASLGIFFIPNTDIQNFTKIIVIGIFFGTICSLFFATSFILIGKSKLESFIKKKEKDPIEFNN